MGISVIVGILGGSYLDDKFDTAPIFFWLGFSLGIGAAIKTVVSIAKILKKETSEDANTNIEKN
jgi:F0F1-type ATP synthase assembly protein I